MLFMLLFLDVLFSVMSKHEFNIRPKGQFDEKLQNRCKIANIVSRHVIKIKDQ